jgi:DNA-directed RNA polymerase III subunit RPC3
VSQHYLKASVVLSHQSPRDKLIAYEAEEKAKIAGLATSKQLLEAKVLAEERLRREEREAEKVGLVSRPACSRMVSHCVDSTVRLGHENS